jgi:hypothetical protein
VPDISRNPKTVKHTKQPHPFRWFLFLILLSRCNFYGLQWYLDLEAQPWCMPNKLPAQGKKTLPAARVRFLKKKYSQQPKPLSATRHCHQRSAHAAHSTTVAAQLTEVAEFNKPSLRQ